MGVGAHQASVPAASLSTLCIVAPRSAFPHLGPTPPARRMKRATIALLVSLIAPHALAAQQGATTVRGVAYDSLHARPLRGALVALGTNRSTISDTLGRFAFDNVPGGDY